MFLVFLLKCILFLKRVTNLKMSITLQPWRILENSKNNPAMIFDDLYENGNKKLQKHMTFKKQFLKIVNNLLIIVNNLLIIVNNYY